MNSYLLKAPCWSSYALLSDAKLPTHCRHLTIPAPNCYEATNGNESATCWSANVKSGAYTETRGWFNRHLHQLRLITVRFTFSVSYLSSFFLHISGFQSHQKNMFECLGPGKCFHQFSWFRLQPGPGQPSPGGSILGMDLFQPVFTFMFQKIRTFFSSPTASWPHSKTFGPGGKTTGAASTPTGPFREFLTQKTVVEGIFPAQLTELEPPSWWKVFRSP